VLLLYHNASPSAFIACIVALAGCVLIPADWTPEPQEAGLISLGLGMLTFCVVILWWPCTERIFLDVACIRQDDDFAKKEGILSLGFILKQSRTMLVLWDSSYFTRLWCVFEFAARLKGLEYVADGQNAEVQDHVTAITVRPCFYGPMVLILFFSLALFVVVSSLMMLSAMGAQRKRSFDDDVQGVLLLAVAELCAGLPFAHALRRHVRAFGLQTQQLRQFSIRDAECFCCKSGHINPETGHEILCDRALIEDAVVRWFGSIGHFDSYVRKIFPKHIRKNVILPYRYLLIVAMPVLWASLGECVWLARAGHGLEAMSHISYRIYAVCCVIPLAVHLILLVFHVTRGGATHGVGDVIAAMRSLGAAVASFSTAYMAERLSFYLMGEWAQVPATLVQGAAIFVVYRLDT